MHRLFIAGCCLGFEFAWHKVYNYADEAAPLLPAGTMLHTILWEDDYKKMVEERRKTRTTEQ